MVGKKKAHVAKIAIAVFGLLLTAGVFFLLSGQPSSLRSSAIEDVYVSSVDQDKAFNTKLLEVSNADAKCSTKSDCASYTRRAYLKFQVGQLPAGKRISQVNLRLFAGNISGDGGQVYLLKDADWNEENITWQNAPQPSSRSIASLGPITTLGWHEVPLPPKYISANSTYSLMIANQDRNLVSFASSDTASKPELFIKLVDDKPAVLRQQSANILAAGDISCGKRNVGPQDCKQMETADLISDLPPPDDILLLGDLQYDFGQLKDFEKSFAPSWGRFGPLLKPAPGNHEYYNSENYIPEGCSITQPGSPFAYACGYFDYFNGKNQLSGAAGQRGQGYYAFDAGNWRIYSLNSNCLYGEGCQAGSAQERWLRLDLANHPDACKLMYMHHPFTSSDARNFDAYKQGLPDPATYLKDKLNQNALAGLYQAFYDFRGDLVLTGHSHYYERFDPQNLSRQADAEGFREIISGTGGRHTYTVNNNNRRPLSVIYSPRGIRGVLSLKLNESNYSWQFMATKEVPFTDSGSDNCHIAR